MKPTIGRIVIYTVAPPNNMRNNGATEAPAVVVRVFDDGKINLKVLLDNAQDAWVTSVKEGTEPGTWHWPVIERPEPTRVPGPGVGPVSR